MSTLLTLRGGTTAECHVKFEQTQVHQLNIDLIDSQRCVLNNGTFYTKLWQH